MSRLNDEFESLALRAAAGAAEQRAAFEATLLPLVRCALSRGVGPANLVAWVRGRTNSPGVPTPTPQELTRQLSTTLLRRIAPRPAAPETTVGR